MNCLKCANGIIINHDGRLEVMCQYFDVCEKIKEDKARIEFLNSMKSTPSGKLIPVDKPEIKVNLDKFIEKE